MEFHFYRLHQETSVILRVWHYLGHSWPAYQAGDLYPCPQHHYVCGLSTSIRPSCIFQAWYSFLCHLWQKLGPYEIIVQPSTLSFTLCLPESMRSVHSVFYVSMLELTISNTFSKRIQPAPAPVIIDREPEYEISWIVDSKIDCWWACKLLYKIIWLGYENTGDESEWISTSKLSHAVDLVSDFHIAYPTKPGPLPLSWTHCCICSLSLCISNGNFPSLISSIFCLLIFINPQLLRTFQGFFSELSNFLSFNSYFSYSHI